MESTRHILQKIWKVQNTHFTYNIDSTKKIYKNLDSTKSHPTKNYGKYKRLIL